MALLKKSWVTYIKLAILFHLLLFERHRSQTPSPVLRFSVLLLRIRIKRTNLGYKSRAMMTRLILATTPWSQLESSTEPIIA